MGVIVNKENNNNNELSRRIDADLRAKMQASMDSDGKKAEDPDFLEDSEYVRDLKKTSKFGWIWIVLIVLAAISLISIFFF